MNMEPLERQAMLQSMMQQQPPQTATSPLTSGAVAAMDNIKRAMALDNDQRRQSLGAAIQHFSANMANPANHHGGALGAAAQSMGPALNAYSQANQRGQSENMQAFEIMQALEKQAEEKRRHAEDEKHRAAQLEETRRYHDLMYQGESNKEFELKKAAGLIPENAVPFSAMSKAEQTKVSTGLRDKLHSIQEGHKILRGLDVIDEITDEYPDLSTDYARLWAMTEPGKEPTVADITKLKIPDQKKRTALAKFTKITGDMLAHKIKLAGGRNATDMYKRTLKSTLADPSLTHDAIKFITKYARDEITPLVGEEEEVHQQLSGRYEIPERIHKFSKEQPVVTEENNVPGQLPAQPLTREAARAKLIQAHITDEAVIEQALKAKGL